MNPEQIERLIRDLMNTGEILATKGYELAYRQVIAEASVAMVVAFLLMLVGAIGVGKLYRKYWERDYTEPLEDLCFIGSLVACVAGILISLKPIVMLLNPEWYAVEKLLYLIIK